MGLFVIKVVVIFIVYYLVFLFVWRGFYYSHAMGGTVGKVAERTFVCLFAIPVAGRLGNSRTICGCVGEGKKPKGVGKK